MKEMAKLRHKRNHQARLTGPGGDIIDSGMGDGLTQEHRRHQYPGDPTDELGADVEEGIPGSNLP